MLILCTLAQAPQTYMIAVLAPHSHLTESSRPEQREHCTMCILYVIGGSFRLGGGARSYGRPHRVPRPLRYASASADGSSLAPSAGFDEAGPALIKSTVDTCRERRAWTRKCGDAFS